MKKFPYRISSLIWKRTQVRQITSEMLTERRYLLEVGYQSVAILCKGDFCVLSVMAAMKVHLVLSKSCV